jgi:cytochrome c553
MNAYKDTDRPENPWPRFGWWFTFVLLGVSLIVGFAVLGRYQQNGPPLGLWSAICRAIGIPSGERSVAALQPALLTATRIAWTQPTLARIDSGDVTRGEAVAVNCSACHGDRGASASTLIPTLAGMNATFIYKQLDDFRAGKRPSGVMGAIATALSDQDSADVAAYFANLGGGLQPAEGERLPAGGRSLRQSDAGTKLVFAGDPERGVAPCAACHGPGGIKLGAPTLRNQHTEYLERQLAAFAEGSRRNDIGGQMRVVAGQLTPEEQHAVALFYSGTKAPGTPGKVATE